MGSHPLHPAGDAGARGHEGLPTCSVGCRVSCFNRSLFRKQEHRPAATMAGKRKATRPSQPGWAALPTDLHNLVFEQLVVEDELHPLSEVARDVCSLAQVSR